MTEKQLNDRIRKMAKSNHISYPENYDAFICRVLEELPEEPEDSERRGRWRRKRVKSGWVPVPVLLLVVLIVVAAGASVGAVVHGYLQRMETMSERQKDEFVASVEDTGKNGDYYSREFTPEEKERGEALAVKYEAGKCYPKQELPVLEDEGRVSAYRVCFLKTSSTFYLPEEELTDEELLQIIDFYYKREYSMIERKADVAKENEIEKDSNQAGILSKKEAIMLSEQYIHDVYKVDVSKWKREVEKYAPRYSKNEYYCVHYSSKDFSQKYSVEFDRNSKDCTVLSVDYEESFEDKKVEKVSHREMVRLNKKGLDIVKKLHPTLTVQNMKCKYMKKISNNFIDGGVEFIYSQDDKTGYILSYSFQTKTFCLISRTYDFQKYEEEFQDRANRKKSKVFTFELRESNVAVKEAN